MNNRKNAYKEVYTILQELNEEEYNKIPPEIIEAIRANMNEEYDYELDEELELKDQQMIPETKGNTIPPSIENKEYNERFIFPNALRLQKENKKILIVAINPIINEN